MNTQRVPCTAKDMNHVNACTHSRSTLQFWRGTYTIIMYQAGHIAKAVQRQVIN